MNIRLGTLFQSRKHPVIVGRLMAALFSGTVVCGILFFRYEQNNRIAYSDPRPKMRLHENHLSTPLAPAMHGSSTNNLKPVQPLDIQADHAIGNESVESVYDFQDNVSQAQLRSGGTFIDFGTSARHKHTLGDWQSGWQGDLSNNGTTYSHMTNDEAIVFFDAFSTEQGGGEIILRGQAKHCSTVTVAINDHQIGRLKFKKDNFSVSSIHFTTGIIGGSNHVTLSCQPSSARKSTSVNLAVDYISIVPSGVTRAPSLTSFDGILEKGMNNEIEAILLSTEQSLTYTLPVSKEMRLRGQIRSRLANEASHLEIMAIVDGYEEKQLTALSVTNVSTPFDIPIGKVLNNQPTAIVFRSLQGQVELQDTQLVVPKDVSKRNPDQVNAKNVILVMVDTLRADRLAPFNSKTRVQTPFLNMLAKESIVFTRALAPNNWTKPSVATVLSGTYPDTHGVHTHGAKLPSTVELSSEHFKKGGYVTAGFVGNGYITKNFGFQKGWDKWLTYGSRTKPTIGRFVVDDAITWLQSRSDNKPFFIYIHTVDPHAPYSSPKKYWSLYDRLPYRGVIDPPRTAELINRIRDGELILTQRDKKRLEALYDGEITYHDYHLKRLYRSLAKSGLLNDTLLIITSDHGEEFFEHGSVGHGQSLHEELIHVPLILRLPGATTGDGRQYSSEVGLADIFPTSCEILALDCPEAVEGRSLVPVIQGKKWTNFPAASFADFNKDRQKAVRMGRFKAIYKKMVPTVYNLEKDPLEVSDCRFEYPIALSMLRTALGQHLGRFVDSGRDSFGLDKKTHWAADAMVDTETQAQLKALGYLGE